MLLWEFVGYTNFIRFSASNISFDVDEDGHGGEVGEGWEKQRRGGEVVSVWAGARKGQR